MYLILHQTNNRKNTIEINIYISERALSNLELFYFLYISVCGMLSSRYFFPVSWNPNPA